VSVPYCHARGTKAALDGLAAANGLLIGQVYFLTDEQRLVVAHAVNAYTPLAKQSEASGGGGGGNATGLGLSTVAEIQALTGTGAIGAANLATAAAYDTVTGINEFNPLWDEFISAYVESDTSSVTFEFNNPVSVIPGTSRVVYLALVAGATTRAVVWGSDYITPPAISVPGSGYKIFRVVLEATPFLNFAETGPLIYVSATELAIDP